MAGLAEIPALVKNLADENAIEIALIENVQRENLNPIEEAAAYVNLMNKCKYDMSDVSRLIGKSESYIRNLIRLNALPASVKKLVEQGELSASHARAIVVADDPEKMAQEIIKGKLSVADVTARVKNGPRAKRARAFVDTGIDAATLKKISDSISHALGAEVKIACRRGGAGVINISFATRAQLNEIVDKICK